MATTESRTRMTVDLGDPELYRAIRHLAIDRGRSVREIVVEALRKWVEEQEAQGDLQDSIAAEEARQNAEPTISLEDYAKGRGWGV